MYARLARRREKRLLRFYNLKNAVCMLDRDLAFRANPSVRTRTLAHGNVVTAQGSMLQLKKPQKNNQRNRRQACFLSFLTSVLTRRLEFGREGPLGRLLVSNSD